MTLPGLTDTERVLLEQVRELEGIVRETGETLVPLDKFIGLLATTGASWNRSTMVGLYVKTQAILSRPDVRKLLGEEI